MFKIYKGATRPLKAVIMGCLSAKIPRNNFLIARGIY